MTGKFKPKKIDTYILTEVASPFAGGLIFFSFIFLMFQALRLADFFIVHGVSLGVLGKMTVMLVATFLPTAVPVAFLIGVLSGFGRLSADSELVAMKANGMSLRRLTLPVGILGVTMVVLSLFLNLDWVPKAYQEFKNEQVRVANTKVVSAIKEGTFTTGFFDLLIYADKLDEDTNRLQRVFIFDEREPKSPLTVVAREGELIPVKGQTELGSSVLLKLYNGNIHQLTPGSENYQKIDFGRYQLFLEVDEGQGKAGFKPGMYTYSDLLSAIDQESAHPKRKKRYLELKAELWRRFGIAFSPLVFVFLGVGFGTIRTRAVRTGAFLVAFVVVLAFWVLQGFGTVLTQKGYLPAPIAMNLPNLLLLPIGIYSFRSSSW